MEIWTDWLGESVINSILFCLIASNDNNGWLFYLIVHNSNWYWFILPHQTEIGGKFIELIEQSNWGVWTNLIKEKYQNKEERIYS